MEAVVNNNAIYNPIVTQRDIFRLSAVLYAESNDAFSTESVQEDVVRCVLCANNNEPLADDEIISMIISKYKYYISEEELINVITRGERNTFESLKIDGRKKYRLTTAAFEKTSESMKNSIDTHIERFFLEKEIAEAEQGKDAIYKYLYELTTTNINSYKILLGNSDSSHFSDAELSVDLRELNDWERTIVHDFVEWDDPEKNNALANLVFCCLEYCLLINGDKVNPLVKSAIRKRNVYLDTNIIFRALGINGPHRQKVTLSFLKKCRQADLNLIILKPTEKEFDDTVSYYVNQIKTYPRGQVFVGAYEYLSDYNMFSFYALWRKNHESLSLNYFTRHIKTLYEKTCREFKIDHHQDIPREISNMEEHKRLVDRYARAIQAEKQRMKNVYLPDDMYYSTRDIHDATVVSFIEYLRGKHEDCDDCFLTSSDKALRYWDMTRDRLDYPVVIYPSQLFLILIKMCGRSANDYDSFVSFINIRPRSKLLTPEKANVIISGISSVTEDIKTQNILVESVFDMDFQNVIQHSNTDLELYQNVQEYSQNYLSAQLKENETKLHQAESQMTQMGEEISTLTRDLESSKESDAQKAAEIQKRTEELEKKQTEIEQNRENVCKFAEKKTKFAFNMKWYVFPFIAAIMVIAFCVFLLLQFTFCDEPWNLANKIFAYIADTTFGRNVEGYVAIIDGAVFTVLMSIVLPQFWVKPWDQEKKEADKQKRIEKYIQKNHLL